MKHSSTNSLKLVVVACFLATTACGFVTPQHQHSQNTATSLFAKKKKPDGGKGFGKAPEIAPTPPKSASTYTDDPMMMEREAPSSSVTNNQASAFSSVEGGTNTIPTMEDPNDSSSPKDRATAILRDQYGLRSRDEQQEAYRKAEIAKEERKKLEVWKKMADDGKDFDIMEVLPAPVLIGIDFFLKAGVTICTILFVLAGFGITVEAWSKASNSPLPPNIDNFIVNVVEPNFTPGLGVLLGFSISLGAFATAQLSSASAVYRQDR